jgi:hypothetical protein
MICPDCNQPRTPRDWPFCPHGEPGPFWRGDSSIHASESITVYRHNQTGKVSIPGRADRPMHPKLAAAGYVPERINSFSGLRQLEKSQGLVHEKSNYNNGSADRDYLKHVGGSA